MELVSQAATTSVESPHNIRDLERRLESKPLSPLPPEEIIYLQVAVGCPYSNPNGQSCTFCGFLREARYRAKDVEEAKQHIDDAVRAYGDRIRQERRRIFIGDGDALALHEDDLREILKYLNTIFNFNGALDHRLDANGIDLFGDAYAASRRSHEFYRELKSLNVTGIHMGIESGLNQLLAAVHKNSSADCIRQAIEKMTSAGITVYGSVIVGLGESRYADEHVKATVDLIAGMSQQAKSNLVISLSNLDHPYKWYVAQRKGGEFGRQLSPQEIQDQRREFEKRLAPLVSRDNVRGYAAYRHLN